MRPLLPGTLAPAGPASSAVAATARSPVEMEVRMPVTLRSPPRRENAGDHSLRRPGTVENPHAAVPATWQDRRVRPTVVIVDDHAHFRAAATALLEAEGFSVVGVAADATGALEAVERLRPQV